MKNIFFKYFVLMVTFTVILSGCIEEKEVQGPIPWTPEMATPIDNNSKSTFSGSYKIADFNMSAPNNIVGLDNMSGGFVINYDSTSDLLQYNYSLKYGGYNNTSAQKIISNTNTILNESDFTIQSDRYTITFNNPIIYDADGITYTINSIIKNDDTVLMIDENTNLDSFISSTITLCDPLLTANDSDDNTCGMSGAMKYIGYYRIEEITCGGNKYTGGIDFAGEMTASAITDGLPEYVTVPITMKFQIDNESLKQCILNDEQIINNNLYFQNIDYTINLGGNTPNFSDIFNNVGLIGLREGTEQERTTNIIYEPKNIDYTNMLFNGNEVQIKLRIMQQAPRNDPLSTPVTLDSNPYWIVNNTGIQ